MVEAENEKADIRLLAYGDDAAFDRLYNRYHRAVHLNILKFVKEPEIAEDILQDVFLSLWQNRSKFENYEAIGGWLFIVSHNKSLNSLRKKINESIEYVFTYPVEPEASGSNIEAEELYTLQMRLLDEAVDNLPARKKEVFKLCRYEGRSKADVAELLGISLQSVNDYLKQSNSAIRKYVLQRYPEYVGVALFVYSFF
ncbi:sigma-70 family RNA polymerase sigma factor [Sphingobacterium shayense]|uniref:RNA polymerase sigma factor n=1 Tax=Sphingobacterium shayense TaxID=626343 RepID=UPI0015581CA0|nr:sigma-70 family RNA polymerase sigma factor [Sphingobacterium shayense]NQD72053.1 sigma-70 family RNA polymerase sigma factor [Sphingobacterium shayense]